MAEANKVRIIIKAFDYRVLDRSAQQILETAERTGTKVSGPVPLPVTRKVFTVIRGPHIDKKSREHFELRIHKRLIDIHSASAKTVDALTRLVLPPGVDIALKL